MNTERVNKFLDKVFSELHNLDIDTSLLTLDHIAYQASSSQDYESKKKDFLKVSTLVSEEIVGNRRVGIFKLQEPVTHNSDDVNIIEIIEPKTEQKPRSDWEHIEFTISIDLKNFMKLYPSLDWNTSKLNREKFPMLILRISDDLQVKFPKRGVIQETKRINS